VKALLEKLNALVLLALFGVTAAAIVFRTVLGWSASWSEELGQYAAVADDGHISITSFVDRLGPAGRRVCKLLQCVLPLPFLVVFAWGAWLNVKANWGTELSTVPWMNVGYMYLCVTLSSIAMTVWLVLRALRLLRAPAATEGVPR
jgi:TRAP-type C4-dicarboxylate transport system permease small subunit